MMDCENLRRPIGVSVKRVLDHSRAVVVVEGVDQPKHGKKPNSFSDLVRSLLLKALLPALAKHYARTFQ